MNFINDGPSVCAMPYTCVSGHLFKPNIQTFSVGKRRAG